MPKSCAEVLKNECELNECNCKCIGCINEGICNLCPIFGCDQHEPTKNQGGVNSETRTQTHAETKGPD